MRTARTLIRSDAQADLSLRWAHNHFVMSRSFIMLEENDRGTVSMQLSLLTNSVNRLTDRARHGFKSVE